MAPLLGVYHKYALFSRVCCLSFARQQAVLSFRHSLTKVSFDSQLSKCCKKLAEHTFLVLWSHSQTSLNSDSFAIGSWACSDPLHLRTVYEITERSLEPMMCLNVQQQQHVKRMMQKTNEETILLGGHHQYHNQKN